MKIPRQSPRDLKIVLAQFHENLLRIDWEIGEKHAVQVNLTAGIINNFGTNFTLTTSVRSKAKPGVSEFLKEFLLYLCTPRVQLSHFIAYRLWQSPDIPSVWPPGGVWTNQKLKGIFDHLMKFSAILKTEWRKPLLSPRGQGQGGTILETLSQNQNIFSQKKCNCQYNTQ